MKIYPVGIEQNEKRGGGWSWLDNFKKGDWEIVTNPEECDIYLITSVSMLDKVSQIPFGKKKIVLRIDNALIDSRNGRIYGIEGKDKITRMEALKQVANNADGIVFQSNWSEEYLRSFLGDYEAKQTVILNGSDDELFNPNLGKLPKEGRVYLYARSSNHDNKGWHVAWSEFQDIYKYEKFSTLWIAGRFSPENNEHNFDFFNGERYKYWGNIQDREMMAMLMRSADAFLFPFFNDSCSQTLIETLLSGIEVKVLEGGMTGGTPEILKAFDEKGREYLSYKRMNMEYYQNFESLLKK